MRPWAGTRARGSVRDSLCATSLHQPAAVGVPRGTAGGGWTDRVVAGAGGLREAGRQEQGRYGRGLSGGSAVAMPVSGRAVCPRLRHAIAVAIVPVLRQLRPAPTVAVAVVVRSGRRVLRRVLRQADGERLPVFLGHPGRGRPAGARRFARNTGMVRAENRSLFSRPVVRTFCQQPAASVVRERSACRGCRQQQPATNSRRNGQVHRDTGGNLRSRGAACQREPASRRRRRSSST